MGWWIFVNFIRQPMFFISSQRRGIKFTNIHQPMLKLKAHSGFHDLFLNYIASFPTVFICVKWDLFLIIPHSPTMHRYIYSIFNYWL
jgi:hypothetical protein